MKHYAHYGMKEFYIALGHGKALLSGLDYRLDGSMTIDFSRGDPETRDKTRRTGSFTSTPVRRRTRGRVKRLEPTKDGTFMLTYGDGVRDVDLQDLPGSIAQAAASPLPLFARRPVSGHLRWGSGGRPVEKPQMGRLINGGSSCRAELRLPEGDDSSLELNALEQLAAERQLAATVTTTSGSAWTPCVNGSWRAYGGWDTHRGRAGVTNFWLDRPTLVTGATGLLGGWMVRRLVDLGRTWFVR